MNQKMPDPVIRERVRLVTQSAEYCVVAVNTDQKTVELMSLDGAFRLLEDVPFSALWRLYEPENGTAIVGRTSI